MAEEDFHLATEHTEIEPEFTEYPPRLLSLCRLCGVRVENPGFQSFGGEITREAACLRMAVGLFPR